MPHFRRGSSPARGRLRTAAGGLGAILMAASCGDRPPKTAAAMQEAGEGAGEGPPRAMGGAPLPPRLPLPGEELLEVIVQRPREEDPAERRQLVQMIAMMMGEAVEAVEGAATLDDDPFLDIGTVLRVLWPMPPAAAPGAVGAGHLAAGGVEPHESVMPFEGRAQASAEVLVQQLEVHPEALDGALEETLDALEACAEALEEGRREARFLPMPAHPERLAAHVAALRGVLQATAQRGPPGQEEQGNLLGGRAVALAWMAIERYPETADGRAAAAAGEDPARHQALMTDTLLRHLGEAVEGGVEDLFPPHVVCGRGVGTRALRALQGYFAAVAIDPPQLAARGLLQVLGTAFRDANPNPTAADNAAFLAEARQVGRRLYAEDPEQAELFEAALDAWYALETELDLEEEANPAPEAPAPTLG